MTEIEDAKIVLQTKNGQEAKPKIRTIESEVIPESLAKGLDTLVVGQNGIQNSLHDGFQEMSKQNRELLEQNSELLEKVEEMAEELDRLNKEREDKKIRRETRANRKRLPKRDEMTSQIYEKWIQAAEGPTYVSVRLRIAFCLLAVTGIRINELRPLKVNQLQTLIKNGWIAINRSKGGPKNHKAFLTQKGKKIVKDREKDFEFMFLMKSSDSYLFTTESQPFEMLSRETITKDVNKVMRSVAAQLPDKPNITSHSFRMGYITQLWKDSKDIEFVNQIIGHRKLDTTSASIKKLSDQERQNRISNLK